MAPEPRRTPATGLCSALCLLLLIASPAHALRIVNYNILNYPGTSGAARDPLFRTILNVVPAPRELTTRNEPWFFSRMARASASPRPRPRALVE